MKRHINGRIGVTLVGRLRGETDERFRTHNNDARAFMVDQVYYSPGPNLHGDGVNRSVGVSGAGIKVNGDESYLNRSGTLLLEDLPREVLFELVRGLADLATEIKESAQYIHGLLEVKVEA